MSTQMEGLRRFVASTALDRWRANDDPVVVVGSGKGGSGTSTVAALLAIACSLEARRTLLVDGDELVGTLHRLFGIDAPFGLNGLRTGLHTPAACVLELEGGLSILPGGPGSDASGRHHAHVLSPGERRALFRRISQLYHDYDVVIVDAGSRLDSVLTAAAAGTRLFLAVAGAGAVAVAANYALIKAIELKWPGSPVDIVVNREDDPRGRLVFEQLREAARRFLGRELDLASAIPDDSALQAAIDAGQPLGAFADQTVAGQAARGLAQRLLVQLDGTRSTSSSRVHRR